MTAEQLIKRFEGLRLDTYLDKVGRPTVGYGFTGVMGTSGRIIMLGLTISADEAETELETRLGRLQATIRKNLKVPVSAGQFAALCSLGWNVEAAIHPETSHLMRFLNEGNVKLAADEFGRWTHEHIHGVAVVDPALEHRRYYERSVFLDEEDTGPIRISPPSKDTP